MSELITISKETDLAKIFSEQDGLKPIIDKIKEEARSFVPDLSTKKGRDQIASMAFKVAKSKTYLDGLGKDVVAEWKAKSKLVDNSRRQMKEELDLLRDEVRKPLTDFENAEKERVEKLQGKLDTFKRLQTLTVENTVFVLEDELEKLEQIKDFDQFEDFKLRIENEINKSVIHIKGLIEKRKVIDAEKAELEELRRKQAETDRIRREEEIRKAEQRRLEKEHEEKLEKERLERQRIENAAKEEAARKAHALELAKKQAEEAEKRRIEAEKEKEEMIKARKEAEEKAKKEAEERRQMLAKKRANNIDKVASELIMHKDLDPGKLAEMIYDGQLKTIQYKG